MCVRCNYNFRDRGGISKHKPRCDELLRVNLAIDGRVDVSPENAMVTLKRGALANRQFGRESLMEAATPGMIFEMAFGWACNVERFP